MTLGVCVSALKNKYLATTRPRFDPQNGIQHRAKPKNERNKQFGAKTHLDPVKRFQWWLFSGGVHRQEEDETNLNMEETDTPTNILYKKPLSMHSLVLRQQKPLIS